MAKEEKKALVPKLRFPEFQSAPAWKTAPLGEIAERVSTKNGDGEVTRVLTNSAEYGVLDQRDYFDRDIATAGKVDGYYIVDAGDYVYNPRTSVTAPVGPISRNNIGKGVMSPLYTVFRFAAEKTDFYEHFFRSTGWHSYVRGAASTGARHDRMSITNGAFMQMPVPTPDGVEQQKVADCLGSLDELIAAQERKVEALKTYKRGLMQQLFPREGETLPRLRFPEFRDAPEWEEWQLDTCFSHIRNGFVGTATPFYVTGGVPYLQGKNVKKGRIDSSGLVTVSKAFHEKQTKSQLRLGDIVMVQSGHVGECALIDERYVGANCHALIILTPVEKQHSPFFVHCFGSDFGVKLIAQITTGNTIKHILASEVKALVVPVPLFEEQQRIANFLSALDDAISGECDNFAALKTHMRGLMQRLFPSPEET